MYSNQSEDSLKAATDETLGIEDSVARVHGGLVFGSIADQALLGGEGDVGGRGPVTLCISGSARATFSKR